jgi:ATP-binding cassette, subfamily B, bacterial
MVASHYGREYPLKQLRDWCSIGKAGVSVLGISEAAERMGLRSLAVKLPFARLKEVPLPCICHWEQNHFVVIHKIKGDRVYVADPEKGLIDYSKDEFLRSWIGSSDTDREESPGILLLLELTPQFSEVQIPDAATERGLSSFFKYLTPHRKLFAQLIICLVVTLVMSLIFPFLTQAIVDVGIGQLDLNIVFIFLIGQLMLSVGQTAVDLLEGWIFLHMGARISISIIADFLKKLLRLPLSFFTTRTAGDIMQRIEDHSRIQSFLTSTSLSVVFSLVSFVVFAGILAIYSTTILLLFVGLTVLSVGWLTLFLKARRALDQKKFAISAQEQDKLVEIVNGIEEIKIQGIEKQKRWEWEEIGIREFHLRIKSLILKNSQRVGTSFIGKIRNALITYISAKAVIDGDMTLGMMLSTQYIIGQLSSPVNKLIDFLYQAQDARISLERMHEVYGEEEEKHFTESRITQIPVWQPIELRDLRFRYPGAGQKDVLSEISVTIPFGKVTAIVGTSGSGKTTLVKLLLGLYQPTGGRIYVGQTPLASYDMQAWRMQCGVVAQDGYIFGDTIANNITCAPGGTDMLRLQMAVELAQLKDYVDSLPLGLETRIGGDGQGVSGGQKQRILIARSLYKNPEYLFLDEATSALDANNESAIVRNLDKFITGKTVIIIAHRLSTVKNADQILVLEQGQIAEVGDHQSLLNARGRYYNLVKDQLELDSKLSNAS